VRVATQSIEAAKENYRIVSDRFNAGRTTSREVLEAEATLSQSQFSYNQARFQYMVVLAQLELLSGVRRESWNADFSAPAALDGEAPATEAPSASDAPARDG
jgi:outer membrane protein TolC